MDKCDTCKYLESPCDSCCASGNYDCWEPNGEYDTVNHPTHYTSGCGFECIEMMEMVFGKEAVIDYCVVNVFKYLWQYKYKNGVEDLKKAQWYLDHIKAEYLQVGVDEQYEHMKDLLAELKKKEGIE